MTKSLCLRGEKLILMPDCAGGDSKTLMIVQVAPVDKNVSETTCSLSFGQRVRSVELGTASRKVDTADLEVGTAFSLHCFFFKVNSARVSLLSA